MISNIINYGGMFILAVMITRMLGVDSLGEFTYVIAVSSIISIASELGIAQLLIRKINEERTLVFSLTKNINIFKFIVSVLIITLSVLILYIFHAGSFNLNLIAGILIVIPKTIYSTYDSSIRALQRQAVPSVIKSINTFIQIIAAYFILLYTSNLLSLFIFIIAAETCTAIVFRNVNKSLWKKTSVKFSETKGYSFSEVKQIIAEAMPFFGSGFLALSIPRLIMIILEYLYGAVSLGIFSSASRIANGAGLLSGAMYNTFYPVITNPDIMPAAGRKLAIKFSVIGLIAGVIIALIIFFTAEILIQITFKIPLAVPLLKILGFSVIPFMFYSVLQAYFFSVKQEIFILKVYIVIGVLIIPFTAIMTVKYGLTGAAYSYLIYEYLLMLVFLIKLILMPVVKES